MEVIWIRQFTVYLGNVVYAFAVFLAIYLSATFSRLERLSQMDALTCRHCLQCCLDSVGSRRAAPATVCRSSAADSANGESTSLGLAWGGVRAVLGIGFFSGSIGFLTPMLVDRRSGGDPGRAGAAYAVNVVGCILGPLLAGFCILPWAGERWGLCLLAFRSLPLASARFAFESRPGFLWSNYFRWRCCSSF